MFRSRKKIKTKNLDTLIGKNSEFHGDVHFSGGLLVHGKIKGNVIAQGDDKSFLTLSQYGSIEGEVKVPNIIINGTVLGDIHSSVHIELAANARITGNVYYALIEMAMGAEVNGNLVRSAEDMEPPMALSHDIQAAVSE